jgi:predicted ArsR family transcriptional regulator
MAESLRYPEGAGFKGDADTGPAGARLINRRSGSIRARSLTILAAGPATAEQIADRIGEHFMIVRARMSEARALGLVEDTGRRGDGALGGKVVVWRLTTPEEKAIHAARKAADAEKSEAAQ